MRLLLRYDWALGDSSNSADTPGTTSHTYAAKGDYTVTRTVIDDTGSTAVDVTQATLATVSVSVQTKAKGGALGVVELLLLAVFVGLLKVARGRRVGSGPASAAVVVFGLLLIAPLQAGAAELSWYGGLGVGGSSADFSAGSFESGMA